MKRIKIIATRDIDGFFSHKTGDVIKEINGKNVTKIVADSKHIELYYSNGLLEYYHADKVRLEVER